MASASFRDSMNSLGWSRRDSDLPVNTEPPSFMDRLQSFNPFGSGGYVQLPTHEGPGAPLPAPTRREEEEGWFARECSCSFAPVLPLHHQPHLSIEPANACRMQLALSQPFSPCLRRSCEPPEGNVLSSHSLSSTYGATGCGMAPRMGGVVLFCKGRPVVSAT